MPKYRIIHEWAPDEQWRWTVLYEGDRKYVNAGIIHHNKKATKNLMVYVAGQRDNTVKIVRRIEDIGRQ